MQQFRFYHWLYSIKLYTSQTYSIDVNLVGGLDRENLILALPPEFKVTYFFQKAIQEQKIDLREVDRDLPGFHQQQSSSNEKDKSIGANSDGVSLS